MSETTYSIVIAILVVVISGCISYWIFACFCPCCRCCLEKQRKDKDQPEEAHSPFNNTVSDQNFNLDGSKEITEI